MGVTDFFVLSCIYHKKADSIFLARGKKPPSLKRNCEI